MHVEVHDPSDKQVLSRAYGSQGRVSWSIFRIWIEIYFQFTFTSHAPGEHRICLMSNSTNWSWNGGKLRVHLDLQVWAPVKSVALYHFRSAKTKKVTKKLPTRKSWLSFNCASDSCSIKSIKFKRSKTFNAFEKSASDILQSQPMPRFSGGPPFRLAYFLKVQF